VWQRLLALQSRRAQFSEVGRPVRHYVLEVGQHEQTDRLFLRAQRAQGCFPIRFVVAMSSR
jgi:hypothetical protein